MKRRTFLQTLAGVAVVAGSVPMPGVAGSRTGLVYSEHYLDHVLQPSHPESPRRLATLMQRLRDTQLLERVQQLRPYPDPGKALYQIHSREHVRAIARRYPVSHEVALCAAGGMAAAADAVMDGRVRNAFCASRPPGHHALNTGREEGFCFYNSIAIVARHLQVEYGLRRILIVDWDYHHGNGTEAAFYEDPSVLFFSTHDVDAYPRTGLASRTGSGAGKGCNINVPLPCGADDSDIISAFETELVPAVESFRPEFILVSAGFDSRESDLLGCFSVTDAGFCTLTELMLQLADEYCDGRLVSILEGGYNLKGNAAAAAAHLDTLLAG